MLHNCQRSTLTQLKQWVAAERQGFNPSCCGIVEAVLRLFGVGRINPVERNCGIPDRRSYGDSNASGKLCQWLDERSNGKRAGQGPDATTPMAGEAQTSWRGGRA